MLFEIGANGPLTIRVENVRIGLPAPLRILYASDLHLGHRWTSKVPARLLDAARATKPDVCLLGGDLVDRAAALPELGGMVATLVECVPVFAVPGNHDERVGVNRVRDAVCSSGGTWLADESVFKPIRIDGAIASGVGPRVLCAHDPSIFPDAVVAKYDLVLAGHLHGGQCVISNRGGKQYPAAWLNRWHGLRFEERGTRMLVSRGAADSFPFRFNCPREVILCELT